MTFSRTRFLPGSLWALVEAGTHTSNYLDEDGEYHTITVGEDGRLLSRAPRGPHEHLIAPGVFREWFLDASGHNLIVAIGPDQRVLERIRVFSYADERRWSGYLRERHGLYDLNAITRRCRVCRAWFATKRMRRVRCRTCINAAKRGAS